MVWMVLSQRVYNAAFMTGRSAVAVRKGWQKPPEDLTRRVFPGQP
jgi:hypothetical protein